MSESTLETESYLLKRKGAPKKGTLSVYVAGVPVEASVLAISSEQNGIILKQ